MSEEAKGHHGENIVRFAALRRRMTDPAITEVRAYWEGLRSGASVPARSDVDPRGIQNTLEYAFILEKLAPTVARFRLAGMHMSDVLGMEVRGMPFTAFFAPEARKEIARVLEAMFDGPQIVEIVAKAEQGIGKPPLSARILLLPLQSDLGDISRVLGCFVTRGQIGRAPRRFTIEAIETTWINKQVSPDEARDGYKASEGVYSHSVTEPDDPQGNQTEALCFDEAAGPFDPKDQAPTKHAAAKRPPRARGKPFLRLLIFND